MADKVFGFTEDGFKRVREATRRVLGSPRTGSQRRRQVPVVGGGKNDCVDRNEIWKFAINGSPDDGSFTFNLNVLGVTDEIEIAFDDTEADIETAFETHTNISDGDIEVIGGPLPEVDLTIEFKGDLAKHRIPPPTSIDKSGLTGGTGVGVFWTSVQPGHPENGGIAP